MKTYRKSSGSNWIIIYVTTDLTVVHKANDPFDCNCFDNIMAKLSNDETLSSNDISLNDIIGNDILFVDETVRPKIIQRFENK